MIKTQANQMVSCNRKIPSTIRYGNAINLAKFIGLIESRGYKFRKYHYNLILEKSLILVSIIIVSLTKNVIGQTPN